MRFINRSLLSPPEILFGERAKEAQRKVKDFIAQSLSKGDTRRPPRSDWMDEDPKFVFEMSSLFDGCCAYCESTTSSLPEARGGVVERHRPGMLAKLENGETELLAYSWLTYDWENLLWLCPACARNKSNNFWIEGERGRPFMSVKELREVEREQLLDPCFHEPVEHLKFTIDGHVVGKSSIGNATIEILNLNRTELIARRFEAVQRFGEALRLGNWRAWLPRRRMRSSEPRPHSGAVALAVGAFARIRDLSVEAVGQLIQSMTVEQREAFSNEFLAQAIAESTNSRSDTVPNVTDTRTLRRIPNIRRLPNALHPITRVEISNFKALREIAFDLPERVADPDQSPCMLLLGENATGKSSVLEAMALAVIGSDEAAALDAAIATEDLSTQT